MGRITQPILDPNEARLQIYIDDPIITMVDKEEITKMISCLCFLLWLILGFGLALHKGQLGYQAKWVGYEIGNTLVHVFVRIKAEVMADLASTTGELIARNMIKTSELRTFISRTNHVASLFFA